MKNTFTNESLAMTQLGLRYTSFKPEFSVIDNEALDAPEFVPSGAAFGTDKGVGVVVMRDGFKFN